MVDFEYSFCVVDVVCKVICRVEVLKKKVCNGKLSDLNEQLNGILNIVFALSTVVCKGNWWWFEVLEKKDVSLE